MEGSGEEEEDFLFSLASLLLRFDFGGGSRASYSWKLLRKTRGTEKAVVSPSFPATAPSTDHTSLSLASLCFRDVPTIYEPETDNRYTDKINPRIKSFFHLQATFILSLAGGKLTALTQGQIWLAGPVYWKWRISLFWKFSQKPITALHTI